MSNKHLFAIAPMMDCTDRHFRYFMRLISTNVFLYTEMITTNAIIYGDRQRLLGFDSIEHPLAVQLGGSDPKQLAQCAKICEDFNYDEINLNVGCPSDRVKAGKFGACLMAEPNLVADCVVAMKNVTKIPITVKTRIGIDDRDSYEELSQFVNTLKLAGCQTIILHARKAWLNGLSPKENRTIPPLQYDRVYQIKKDFPDLEIIINGGITTTNAVQNHLLAVDGVMIGREAYANPYFIAEIEQKIFSNDFSPTTRAEILDKFIPYIQKASKQGVPVKNITRHIVGLFKGEPGARAWRGNLTSNKNFDFNHLTFPIMRESRV